MAKKKPTSGKSITDVLGTFRAPRTSVPVTAHACRRARAADLKTASAAWCPFFARITSTWRLNLPRNAADFQNSSTSANGKSFVTSRSSLSTGDSKTM